MFEQKELLNSLIVDFDQIKPIACPNLIYLWDDLEFLYDSKIIQSTTIDNNINCTDIATTATTASSPSPSCFSSSSNTSLDSWPESPSLSNLEEDVIWFEPLSPSESTTTVVDPMVEKPHCCPFCPRAFSRRHDLERHTRVHTGVKPYQCPCCQKQFARSDARGRHFRSDPTCARNIQVQQKLVLRKKGSRIMHKINKPQTQKLH